MMPRFGRLNAAVLLACLLVGQSAHAQRLEMPRRHDRPPGPPVSAEEAVAKMTVPEGFTVEIVAAEPDVVNPVAMFIDEKGRYWITESFEYPRKEPGPGRDRIKVLEDTDGDGRVDEVTVFAEGLNIPSGIAVGYGGVWVANAPDILFLQDTDGDLKADKQEVIVTGFGRDDTHELPNSFTWGPDGWLYGLNGVFNYCDVKYAATNPHFKPDHPGWKFTCAMWRIHPRTREFQIFAEGTSNPWGIAINDEGDFFISACVIDHLWHIVETGYYIRQGGPYPPHTWPIESIVDHHHQKAAYCGITWFDSDCYPEEYRKVLYMGNIHGGCINADVIERHGSTYKGKAHPGFTAKPQAWKDDEYGTIAKTGDAANPKLADFLTANDPWFMPVVQTTGPDGCLYILDWYDRYHCYQDANADPAGIERERGRLYRVRYKDTPHAQPFDLATKSNDELIALLGGPNEYVRHTARRLLGERGPALAPDLVARIVARIDDSTATPSERLAAMWTLSGIGPMDEMLLERLVQHADPLVRSWGIRLTGNHRKLRREEAVYQIDLADQHADPRVRLQAAIAQNKLRRPWQGSGDDESRTLLDSRIHALLLNLTASIDDPLLPQVIWQNLLPCVQREPERFAAYVDIIEPKDAEAILARALSVMLDAETLEVNAIHTLVENLRAGSPATQKCLQVLVERARQKLLTEQTLQQILKLTESRLEAMSDEGQHPATNLLAMIGYKDSIFRVRKLVRDVQSPGGVRLDALKTLIALDDPSVADLAEQLLATTDPPLLGDLIATLGTSRADAVGHVLLGKYNSLPNDIKPRALEVVTQRPAWTQPLLEAVAAKQIDKDALNLNQLRRIATFKDEAIQKSLKELYGEIREGRDPNREQVFYKTRDFLNGTPGDPLKGEPVFKKVCGQCHKLYGEGAEVGPDITRNGRNNWDQLLWNLLDPSQVIGPGYQARILVTTDGRTLTGLPVEESDQRVVLKVQGGKQETIPRDQIEVYKVSELSMMPDQLEKQLTPQELADLLSFLAHDKHPRDPEARLLPGAPSPQK